MRITESQLRKIIREVLDDEYDEYGDEALRSPLDYMPEPKTKAIGPDYRLPNRQPVTDSPAIGGYKLYADPETAYYSLLQGEHGAPTSLSVHRDPKTGKYWGRAKYTSDYEHRMR